MYPHNQYQQYQQPQQQQQQQPQLPQLPQYQQQQQQAHAGGGGGGGPLQQYGYVQLQQNYHQLQIVPPTQQAVQYMYQQQQQPQPQPQPQPQQGDIYYQPPPTAHQQLDETAYQHPSIMTSYQQVIPDCDLCSFAPPPPSNVYFSQLEQFSFLKNVSPFAGAHPHPQLPSSTTSSTGYARPMLSGRKKALLIGINYYNLAPGQGRLGGCINDILHIYDLLTTRYAFHPSCIRVLADAPQAGAHQMPTRANMIQSMQWLVQGAQPGDSLFFHYSGHGAQTVDADGDEIDGMDETICPVDFKTAGMIVDDDLHDILVRSLPPGARLHALMDCCHSGTALDLPFAFTPGQAPQQQQQQQQMMMMNNFMLYQQQQQQQGMAMAGSSIKADVVLISGCMDTQTSMEMPIPLVRPQQPQPQQYQQQDHYYSKKDKKKKDKKDKKKNKGKKDKKRGDEDEDNSDEDEDVNGRMLPPATYGERGGALDAVLPMIGGAIAGYTLQLRGSGIESEKKKKDKKKDKKKSKNKDSLSKLSFNVGTGDRQECQQSGAMTLMFIKALTESNGYITYAQLIQYMREELRRANYRQVPQLSFNHAQMDMTKTIFML